MLAGEQEAGRSFLANLASLEMLSFVPVAETVGPPRSLERYIFRYAEVPFARIAAYDLKFVHTLKLPTEPLQLSNWLIDCCRKFVQDKEYLIAFGACFGYIDWAKVRAIDHDRWLCDVWEQTSYLDVMALSVDQTTAFLIYRAEYYYEAYIHRFDFQAHPLFPITAS